MSLCFFSLETSKVFNQLILEELQNSGFDGLSEALVILFPYLEEDTRITASQLAKKMGYSRQAMHKNIKKLEEFGYITLVQENQKEKIIRLTDKSKKLLEKANAYISNVEQEVSRLIGEKELQVYKKSQMKVYEYLQSIKND